MNIKNLLIAVLLLTAIFTACDDDDEKITAYTTIDASSSDNWVYFSFENNDTVSVENPQESDAWDIAFKRLDFKTNSGTSGNANGGAYKSDLTNLDQELCISSSMIVADDSIQVFEYSMHGATESKVEGSVELSGTKDAYAFYVEEGAWSCEGTVQARTYSAVDNVFFIKCSDGEYAKVQFAGYYSLEDGTTSAQISFNYVK